MPAENPIIEENISLKLNSKVFLKSNLLSYNFTATGPDHFNIYLSPKVAMHLVNISFDTVIPQNAPVWNGRSIYFVNYAWGVSKVPLQFSVELEVPDNWNKTTMEIAISGKYVHDEKNKYTVQFRAFMDDFPKWANIVPAVANFESWEI